MLNPSSCLSTLAQTPFVVSLYYFTSLSILVSQPLWPSLDSSLTSDLSPLVSSLLNLICCLSSIFIFIDPSIFYVVPLWGLEERGWGMTSPCGKNRGRGQGQPPHPRPTRLPLLDMSSDPHLARLIMKTIGTIDKWLVILGLAYSFPCRHCYAV